MAAHAPYRHGTRQLEAIKIANIVSIAPCGYAYGFSYRLPATSKPADGPSARVASLRGPCFFSFCERFDGRREIRPAVTAAWHICMGDTSVTDPLHKIAYRLRYCVISAQRYRLKYRCFEGQWLALAAGAGQDRIAVRRASGDFGPSATDGSGCKRRDSPGHLLATPT